MLSPSESRPSAATQAPRLGGGLALPTALLSLATVVLVVAGCWLAEAFGPHLGQYRTPVAAVLLLTGTVLAVLGLSQWSTTCTDLPDRAGPAGPSTLPAEPASAAAAAVRPNTAQQLAQQLAMQTGLLQGLPGPALLLRPHDRGWQWLASNEEAQASLPGRDTPEFARLVDEQMGDAQPVRPAQAGPSRPAARRLDLPEGCCILWWPPYLPQPPSPPPSAEVDALSSPAPDSAHGPSQLDEDRAAIVYTVSHDLRAPIRVIEGFTRIVREDYGHLLDRVGNDHLERVLGAASRMNSMIDALLALSRLSTAPLQNVRVDLTDLAAQVMAELRQQSPQRQADVRIEPGLSASGDPTLLRMVLDNLLGNAWKYSSRRDIAMIEFGRTVHKGQQVFFVRDNGAGFDMRFASRLFGAFQRLHGATEFAGTGIGLASVRRIIRRHSGEIWAESAVNEGATFYFTLG